MLIYLAETFLEDDAGDAALTQLISVMETEEEGTTQSPHAPDASVQDNRDCTSGKFRA